MADQSNAPKQQKRSQIEKVRDTALERARTTARGLEANPVGVLVGGLAAGMIAGALVPRGEREKAALQPVGKRLAEGAVAALAAAKATGKEQLSAGMLSRDAARQGARAVFDSALSAAKGASQSQQRDDAAPAA